jgi:PDZ domain-containing protein
VRTLIVAGALFLLLLVLAMTLPVPYVVLTPGPTYNTLGTYNYQNKNQNIIVIDGRTPNKTTGNLNLTTVSYSTSKLTVFDALSAWLQSDEVVVPRSSLFPPGQSTQQVDQQNTADFAESQDDAVAAAGCELGYPAKFGVVTVLGTGAAHNKLVPGDLLNTVDGKPANTSKLLLAILTAQTPGTKVTLGVTRAGKSTDVPITLGKPVKGRSGASLGIEVGSVCQMPFTVDLGLGNQIGGPSAGTMFALGIIDKVGKVDLTHGRFIAGTGTIDAQGKVGPIGGIALKMIAARDAGATVFLAPSGNCSDVNGAIPSGLDVVKVNTLHDAVIDLEKTAKNEPVPHC